MRLSEIQINAAAVEEGEWIGDLPEMGDLRLKVRGLNNDKYRRLQQRLIEATPRAKRPGGRLDPAEQDRITAKCLTDTVLLDWSGLEGDEGPIAYSAEMAKTLLTDPQYRRFRDAVIAAASRVEEVEAEARQDDLGK